MVFLEAGVLKAVVLCAVSIWEVHTAILVSGGVSCSSSSCVSILQSLSVCKAEKLSIRRGLGREFKEDFSPQWIT